MAVGSAAWGCVMKVEAVVRPGGRSAGNRGSGQSAGAADGMKAIAAPRHREPARDPAGIIPLRRFDDVPRALAQARGVVLVQAVIPGMFPLSRLRAVLTRTAGAGTAGSFTVRGACGHVWPVPIPPSGRLRRGWHRCPNGCGGVTKEARR